MSNGGMFINLQSVDHADDPKYKDVIRMTQFLQGEYSYDKEDPSILYYRDISYSDVKGYVPTSLLNMVVRSQFQKEFKNMYLHVTKQKKLNQN